MEASAAPVLAGVLVFLASLVSLRLGLSVAVVEIVLGIAAGNFFGFTPEPWMSYLASFGGIVLTFLAGAEVDLTLLRSRLKESAVIGAASFSLPLLAGFAYAHYLAGWSVNAALVAGIALSANSIAVVYSVLFESGFLNTALGKTIMAATFVTNLATAIALNALFTRPDGNLGASLLLSAIIIFAASAISGKLFNSKILKNKVIEPEIKYVFLLILALVFLADFAQTQAVLPAFLLGVLLAPHLDENAKIDVKNRLRTVAYALVTPFFFIIAGLSVSLQAVGGAFGVFAALVAIKLASKTAAAYFFVKKYLPAAPAYATLLMSVGLTFGVIASLLGRQADYLDSAQFSILTASVVATAVIPVVIAQTWFRPSKLE